MPFGPGLLFADEHGGEDQAQAETDPEAEQDRRRRVAGDRPLDATVAPGRLITRRIEALAEALARLLGAFLNPPTDILDLLARPPIVTALALVGSALALGLSLISGRHRRGSFEL